MVTRRVNILILYFKKKSFFLYLVFKKFKYDYGKAENETVILRWKKIKEKTIEKKSAFWKSIVESGFDNPGKIELPDDIGIAYGKYMI